MPYNMVGENPIEFYYPDGYGELNIVERLPAGAVPPIGEPQRRMSWVSPELLNRSYDDSSPPRPIYENQRILREGDVEYASFGCETTLRLKAAYQSYRNAPPTTGGNIKYAIISGLFAPSLTLDIDTGVMFGKIDDMETIFAAEFGGITVDADRPQDLEAASTYNYNFGEQGPKRYTEDNYGQAGSATLHEGGFPVPKDMTFIARAFNSDDPLNDYIDGRFTVELSNNWSSDRDAFILNIRNQFFIDGKPVTNKEYLTMMKSRGYFPSCS